MVIYDVTFRDVCLFLSGNKFEGYRKGYFFWVVLDWSVDVSRGDIIALKCITKGLSRGSDFARTLTTCNEYMQGVFACVRVYETPITFHSLWINLHISSFPRRFYAMFFSVVCIPASTHYFKSFSARFFYNHRPTLVVFYFLKIHFIHWIFIRFPTCHHR